MKFYAILIMIFAFCNSANSADVYRIVDENGRIQYSQIPPYEGAEKIKIKGVVGSGAQATPVDQATLQERQKRYSDYLESERLERKNKREQVKKEKAKLAANCHSVRAELEDMNQGGIQYYDLDENGERVYIDESRVKAKKTRLKTYLDKNCKSIVNVN